MRSVPPPPPPGDDDPVRAPRQALEEALYEIKRVIVGQDAMLERLLVALLANGHVLLEGVPGLAKTLTVKTLARVLGGTYKRVQFTPDLVPADLVGTRIWRPDNGGGPGGRGDCPEKDGNGGGGSSSAPSPAPDNSGTTL